LLVAGATGILGSEVMRRMVGMQGYSLVTMLAREPMTPALRSVSVMVVPHNQIGDWQVTSAQTGIIMFEPPRLYYDRERALWTPQPQDLRALAQWMHKCGVRTLAIVLPHAQGRLPDALKRGLASLDEHAVVAMGFERILIVRSARKAEALKVSARFLQKTAEWMLSIVSFMVPPSEQPVRPSKLAELVQKALSVLPPGTHIAPPELVWQAAQGSVDAVVRQWLHAASCDSTAKSTDA
jgi:hypothetical protein